VNKLFTVLIENTLAAAGGGDGWTMNCPIVYRRAKLQSVLWDLRIYKVGPVNNIPLSHIDFLSYNLNIGGVADMLGNVFVIDTAPGGGVVSQNGIRFTMFRPGFYLFDSGFIYNQLTVSAAFTNNHATDQYHYQSQVVLELKYG